MTATAIPLSRHPTTDPMSVDQLVQMLLSAGEDSEAAIGAVVNSIFVQNAPEQVQQVHDRLMETDSVLAEQFKAISVRRASVRLENGKPDSYLFAVPVGTQEPQVLSKNKARALAELIYRSGWTCLDAKVLIYPISINLENVASADPVDLWEIHTLLPAHKDLPKNLWNALPDPIKQSMQTFIGVVQVPEGKEHCIHREELPREALYQFHENASAHFFRGKYLIAPPMLLLDALTSVADEAPEDELFHSLVGHVHDAMTQLAGEDYEARIVESEDSLTLIICADTGECMESPFPYTEKGLSRAEAFMMVYDALKIAGVGATILNDEEEDDDDDSDTPFITH